MKMDQSALAAIDKFAARLGCEPAALLAVVEVESNGVAFAVVDGRNEPIIRYEGHYFDQRLRGTQRTEARAQGLASPTVGGVKNPASQAARWQIVRRAMAIDEKAALESVSWGVGQVMGAHWAWLGFPTVQALVSTARGSLIGQIELMVRFIEKSGLADELQRRDFAAFARGYNGPAFRKNQYDVKMAQAYKRHSGTAPVSASRTMLRMGSEGARVRDLQVLLKRAGHPVTADGDFGPATKNALQDFQRAQGISPDGVAGPETMRRLTEYRQSPEEQPGAQKIADVPQVRSGGATAVAGGLFQGASSAVQSAADRTFGVTGLESVSAVLTLVAALLVIGGLAWAAWGLWRSRKTIEGDVSV